MSERVGWLSEAPTRVFLAAAAVVIISLIWIAALPHGILMGDDLSAVSAVQHGRAFSNPLQAVTLSGGDKYRPVLGLVLWLLIGVFGNHFAGYETVAALIELGNAAIIGLLVFRLTRSDVALASLAAVSFVVSRFCYYDILQVLGIMEGLALLFMLLAMLSVERSYSLGRLPGMLSTAGWYLLAVFTDERYLTIGAFLVLAVFLHPAFRTAERRRGIQVALAIVAVFLLNIVVKVVIFRSPLLVGTGGHLIKFDARQVIDFLGAGLANVFGFNVGPSYLAGADVSQSGIIGYVVGALTALPAAAVLIAFLVQTVRTRSASNTRAVVLAIALFVPLLASSAVAIRQEFRWLYAVFAVFIIALPVAGWRMRHLRWPLPATLVALLASLTGTLYFRGFVDNVYFVYSMNVARDVRNAVLSNPSQPLVLATHGDKHFAHWVFRRSQFFEIYGLTTTPVRYVDEPSDLSANDQNVDLLVVKNNHAERAAVPVPPVQPFPHVRISLVRRYPDGKINDEKFADTPTKRGALVMPWPGLSPGMSSLTVLSSFRYTYKIAVHAGDALAFYTGRPLAVGAPTRASVVVADGLRRDTVDDEMLTPATSQGVAYRRHVISLTRYAGRTVMISFSADSPSGDLTGAWVAFAEPSVLGR